MGWWRGGQEAPLGRGISGWGLDAVKEGAGRLSGGAHSREREPHVQSPREGSVPSKLRNSTDVGRAGGKGLVGREGGEQSGQAAQSPAMGPRGPWGGG